MNPSLKEKQDSHQNFLEIKYKLEVLEEAFFKANDFKNNSSTLLGVFPNARDSHQKTCSTYPGHNPIHEKKAVMLLTTITVHQTNSKLWCLKRSPCLKKIATIDFIKNYCPNKSINLEGFLHFPKTTGKMER
jgi:hypothetical protein